MRMILLPPPGAIQRKPSPSRSRDEELDDLVFAYLERREAGEPHASSIEGLISNHPERAADLEAGVEALRAAGLLKPDGISGEDFPEQVGGYTLGRRLGSGGMGVVFLAEDSSGERVALKLVRPEQLYFDRARARFQRELDSAARLQHPGIASMLASGEEHGIPYLAQTWIPGASLEKVLARLRTRAAQELTGVDLMSALGETLPAEAQPAEFHEDAFAGKWEDTVLRLVVQVARALDHAHSRGVLHRDVKPSNIVLEASGRAVLVDFGLASVAEADRLTRTGAQPGSLPYMAPEQIEGSPRDLDARTDVYGLGVTLYELLTLQQPFKSTSTERVRSLILEAHPWPPRRHNVRVSKQAETLCLKAMDRDPRRRYASAREFAADIERRLARVEIQARPVGLALSLARWARRKPAQAAGMLLLTAGPLGWAIVTQWAMTEVQAAYSLEQSAHARADRHLELTLEVIRDLLGGLASGALARTPHMQRTRLEAIDLALGLIEKLEQERPEDVMIRVERGNLLRFRGDVLGDIGRGKEAFDAYTEQVEIFEDLIPGATEALRLSYRREMSLGKERAAAILSSVEGASAAVEAYAEAVTLLREVAQESSNVLSSRAQLAVSLSVYSLLLRDVDRLEEALAIADEGVELTDVLLAASPFSAMSHQNAARLLSARRSVLEQMGEEADALAVHERVVELLLHALEFDPENRRIQESLASECGFLSKELGMQGQLKEALEASQRGLEFARSLAAEFPSIERYEGLLVAALGSHASSLVESKSQVEAAVIIQEQVKLAEPRFLADPTGDMVATFAAASLHNLSGLLFLDPGRLEEAQDLNRRAGDAHTIALKMDPDDPFLMELGSSITYTGALVKLLQDDLEGAEELIEQYELAPMKGPRGIVFSADLWAEWVQCQLRADPQAQELVAGAREYCLELLEEAVEAGLGEADLLLESTAFSAVLGNDPRFLALLAQLRDS